MTPNHFVFGLCVHAAQKEFAWRLKIRRGAQSHATVGPVYDKAIARCRTRIGQDHSYLYDGMARFAAAIDYRRGHGAPHCVAEAPTFCPENPSKGLVIMGS
jgi:hypothetical protein